MTLSLEPRETLQLDEDEPMLDTERARTLERLRWRTGELAASECVRGLVRDMREVVGLGCIVPNREYPVWIRLNNSAEYGAREFEVSGEDVRDALLRIRGTYPEAQPHVLWHCHFGDRSAPSQTDVESFPAWLCGLGAVWHVPSSTLTLYDQDGVISALETIGVSSDG